METIKVRIKKCESRVFWYQDLVGKEFIVIAENQIGYEVENNILNGHTIRKEDCEVIETSKEDEIPIGYKPKEEYIKAIDDICRKWIDIIFLPDQIMTNLISISKFTDLGVIYIWFEPVYKPKEKTQRELDNEEILRIGVEIMKSDKTISEYLIEGSYYIGKRTKK